MNLANQTCKKVEKFLGFGKTVAFISSSTPEIYDFALIAVLLYMCRGEARAESFSYFTRLLESISRNRR